MGGTSTMTQEELDLWSDINNPNNDADMDDWADAHNPNSDDYLFDDEEDDKCNQKKDDEKGKCKN